MPSAIRGREGAVASKGYLEGGPELAAKLQAIEKSVRDELLVQATTAGAELIAAEWRSQIASKIGRGPGTAHYEDAVGIRARPGKKGATAWIGLPNQQPTEKGEDQPRDYAPRLEFGHFKGGVHQAPRPTLRPAFDASRQRALDAMGAVCWALIEKAL